jgi:tryptophan-rich sensory protein
MTMMTGPRPNALMALLGWLGLCFVVAALGSLEAEPSMQSWYFTLQKPELTPPNWIFGPMWTLLYAAMAVAAWLAWKTRWSSCRTRGLRLFGVQLFLNVTWTWIFFNQHRPDLALIDIALLWIAIALTAQAFYKISQLAAGLMVAYLAWVTYAGYLNWGIWRLNP